jgi:hypothetical protein
LLPLYLHILYRRLSLFSVYVDRFFVLVNVFKIFGQSSWITLSSVVLFVVSKLQLNVWINCYNSMSTIRWHHLSVRVLLHSKIILLIYLCAIWSWLGSGICRRNCVGEVFRWKRARSRSDKLIHLKRVHIYSLNILNVKLIRLKI